MRSFSVMHLAPLILPLCLFISCERKALDTVRIPKSLQVDHFDLPITSLPADQLSPPSSDFVEALLNGDLTELHHPDGIINSTASGQSFDEVLSYISRSVPYQGKVPPLLISASASMKFAPIRTVIRSAATAGIYRIHFLVRSHPDGNGVIPIELPTMGGSTPKIEPFFIRIDAKGEVFSGTGAGSTRLDGGPEGNDLENLNGVLELFAAAAKSAGYEEAPCQIYVSPEASYQRMIDVLSMLRKWNLKPYFTDMEPELHLKPVMSEPPRKPSAPSRAQPLPLAPPRD